MEEIPMEKINPDVTTITPEMLNGVKGFNLCAFFVALEGFRRGLTLKFYFDSSQVGDMKNIGFDPIGKFFSLSSKERTHYFFRSRGDKVSNEAVDICTNKGDAKVFFHKGNVPTPEGRRFTAEETDETIVSFAKNISFPLVIKPTFGSLGKGVVTNITNEEEFVKSLHHVRNDLGEKDIIVETYHKGEDYRVYVIEDKVVGVIKRIAANVIGDGESTIAKLIEEKNEERKKNPHFLTRLITIDSEVHNMLAKKGYTLETIPPKGEQIFLKGKSNISSGGDSIDVTDCCPEEIKRSSILAVKAIPNLHHAGVDIIYDGTKAIVIEINPTAGISLHQFPALGQAQNVAGAIVDYYFPETKGLEKSNMYFGFKEILRMLRSKFVTELTVTKPMIGKIYAKKYIISGSKVQGVGFRYWIRKQAILQNLYGYTKNLKNGNVVVIVASTDKAAVDGFKSFCMQGPERAVVEKVTESVWDKPIKVGFEIVYNSNTKNAR
jgi:cyanophycin synthetase